MTDDLPNKYLRPKEAVEKYSFLTKRMLARWLYENTQGFRTSVAKKIGQSIFLDEEALLRFFEENPAE